MMKQNVLKCAVIVLKCPGAEMYCNGAVNVLQSMIEYIPTPLQNIYSMIAEHDIQINLEGGKL